MPIIGDGSATRPRCPLTTITDAPPSRPVSGTLPVRPIVLMPKFDVLHGASGETEQALPVTSISAAVERPSDLDVNVALPEAVHSRDWARFPSRHKASQA